MRKRKNTCLDTENKVKREDRPRIQKYILKEDELGRYLPYCDFSWHRGIAFNQKIYEERRCHNYKRIYVQAVVSVRKDLRSTIQTALEKAI